MFCVKCGTQIVDDAAFCQKCGIKVVEAEIVPSGGNSRDSISSVNTDKSVIPEKSEAVIQSYNAEGTISMKIQVTCNGQHVGTIKKNESIVVPISTVSTLGFKCGFRTTSISVQAGKRIELKLEFDRGSGKLRVFNLRSGESIEEIERMDKRNKKWLLLPVVCFVLFIVLRLVSSLIGGEAEQQQGPVSNIQANIEVAASTSPSAQTQNAANNLPEIDAVDSISGEILYKGEPIVNWLNVRPKYLYDDFGTPNDEGLEDGMRYYVYDGVTFLGDTNENMLHIMGTNPSVFEIDGITLDKSQTELTKIFGNPTDEGYGDYGAYYINFDYGDYYTISFAMDGPNDKPYGFDIFYSSHPDDELYGYEEDDYNDEYNASSYPVTADGNMLSVGSPVNSSTLLGTWSWKGKDLVDYALNPKGSERTLTFYSNGTCSGKVAFSSYTVDGYGRVVVPYEFEIWSFLEYEQILELSGMYKEVTIIGAGDLKWTTFRFKVEMDVDGKQMTLENIAYPESKEIVYSKKE